jgi:hypothetical protein
MAAEVPELEAAIDRLYQLPIAEFTSARNELAAERKAANDKEGATRVKALAKPTAVAWAVNQLYWRERERWDALARAMAELASAQREAASGSGAAELREAARRKGETLQPLLRAAERRLAGAGGQASPAVLQRVAATLEAATSPRPASARAPGAGRLASELEPSGFELALGLGGLDLPPAPRSRPAALPEPRVERAKPPASKSDDDEAQAARLAFRQAEFQVARLRREAESAARALAEAESRAAAASTDVSQLASRLEQAKARAAEKATAESDARRALEAARAGLAEAEGALAALKQGA